jgi:hypothetical protein
MNTDLKISEEDRRWLPTIMPLIAIAVAACVSIGSLMLAGERNGTGQWTLSPFGWRRVMIVHALSALPLSWSLSHVLGGLMGRTRRWLAIYWLIAGALAAAMTVEFGNVAARMVDSAEVGYVARLFCRTSWCVAIQFPWCMWNIALASPNMRAPQFLLTHTHRTVWSGVVAFGLPSCFLAIFVPQQVTRATDLWQRERFVNAFDVVQRLCAIGTKTSLGERSTSSDDGRTSRIVITPQIALAELGQAVRYISLKADELKSAEQNDVVCMQLAAAYRSLNRMADAEAVLKISAARTPAAALLLAEIHLEQDHYEASRQCAESALRMSRGSTGDGKLGKPAEEILVQAYFLLGLVAGKRNDLALAERYLLEALAQASSFRADVHAKLASHYEFTGQLYRSREHQRMAAKLAPLKYSQPKRLAMMAFSTGAPIGLARPQSSTYK